MRRRRLGAVVAVLSFLLVGILAEAPTASAIQTPGGGDGGYGCSGYGCDHQDPYATDCYLGAYIVGSSDMYELFAPIGRVDLWYSPGCGTNWAEVDNIGLNGTATYRATIWRGSTSDTYQSQVSGTYTNMLYAPKVVACADGSMSYYDSWTGTTHGPFTAQFCG